MQLRLSPVIRIAGCAVSMLIFFYSVQRLVALKNKSEGTLIHCLSAFDSQVNNSRLQGKVTLYLYRGRGSLQISGDYISPAGVHTPVKLVSGMAYLTTGEDYHVRFTGNKTSFRGDDVPDEFSHLLHDQRKSGLCLPVTPAERRELSDPAERYSPAAVQKNSPPVIVIPEANIKMKAGRTPTFIVYPLRKNGYFSRITKNVC